MHVIAGVQRRWGWAVFAIAVCACVLVYALTREVLFARTFPLVHDAAILHYVTFMIGLGHAPYLQQVEMNLPGVLMTEWLSMHMFGAAAAGLWRWDTFVGLCAVAVSVSVAGRGYRVAGACGAMLTWIVHLNDGAYDLGEREWLVSVLLMGCTGCAVLCLERRQAAWMLPCLALGGWASAIKPFAVLLPMAVCAFVLTGVLRPGIWGSPVFPRRFLLRALGWAVAGGLLPVLATVSYFHHWPGSFAAFLQTEHTLGAWYAGQGQADWDYILLRVVSYPVMGVLALTVYLAVRCKCWRDVRLSLLVIGAIVGFAMYAAQRKGFPYHVYPMLLFWLVLGFGVAQRGLASLAWDRRVLAVALLLVGGVRVPLKLWREHAKIAYPIGTQMALVQDLRRLGGASLNGRVQCLDMTLGGCIGALYDLRLEQPTGFVNDNMLFPEESAPFLVDLQRRFLREMDARPPQVIVLTAHNWPDQDDFSFSKLERWPAFATWLNARYRLDGTHVATTYPHTADYRLYMRR